jgi:RNA polymerase sigma-70 factor (ECF subfamily)
LSQSFSEKDSSGEAAKTEAFFRLFMENQKRIYTYVLMLVPNNSDADDIMQDTATALWQQFERFEPGTNFAPWAVRVAHYPVLQFYKILVLIQ